jgi:hypothetical protein
MALSAHLIHSIQASQTNIGAGLFTFRETGSILNGITLSRIENDPHIRAVLEKRYSGVANKRIEVIARSHADAEAKGETLGELDYEETRGVDIVEAALTYSNISKARAWLTRSRLAGVAVVVVDWVIRDGLIIPWFRPVDFDWIGFRQVKPDEECSRLGSFGIVINRGGMGQPVPPMRAIAVNYGQRSDNPWGWGLGETLYYLKEIRSEMLKFGLIHGDRYASPVTVTEESQGNTLSAEDRNSLVQWLDTLTQQAYAVLPPGVSAKTLAGERSGGDFFLESYARIADEISRLILGETGTTDQSGSGGSRARDEVAAGQQEGILAADCDDIDNILSETLAHWVTELNAPGATPPIIRTRWAKNKEAETTQRKANEDALKVAIENYKALTEMGFTKEDPEISPFEGWEPAKAAASEDGEEQSVQAAALNGAQITSLQGIIEAVSEGRVPPDTGKYLIKAGFPALSTALIDRMIDPVKKKIEEQSGPSRWDKALGAGETPAEGEEPSEFSTAPLETRYAHIDTTPPDAVKESVRAAIEKRKAIAFKDRAADSHLQTALRLMGGRTHPDELRTLSDWFNRMESRGQHKGGKGAQAWALRGGDVARDWLAGITEAFEQADLGIEPEPPPDESPLEFAADDDSETPDSLKKAIAPAADQSFAAFTQEVGKIVAGGGNLEDMRKQLDGVAYSPALGVLLGGAMSAAHVLGINEVKAEIND